MTPDELLALVKEERRVAIGFDLTTAGLVKDREQALEYSRGVMKDVPSLPNRSKAVSTDVNDAIETVLPDLMQILAEDEDVLAFLPQGPEDEQGAQQESDYVKHVVFDLNPGFQVLETAIRDCLQVKTGLVKWWREDNKTEDRQTFEGKTYEEMAVILAQAGVDGFQLDGEPKQAPDGTWTFVCCKYKTASVVRIAAWPAEDFAVAADTVNLLEGTYCAARSRPRRQDLIAQGYDAEKVRSLSPTNRLVDNITSQSRDTVDETDQPVSTQGDHAMVEVIEHYVRVLGDDGKLCLWKVVTGNNEAVALSTEQIDRVPFADLCPFPESHRFIGRSLADLLMEIQRIKTALTRIVLDAAYFALNQRLIVSENGQNEHTLADILDNRPGLPIRAKDVGAVAPLSAGAIDFDLFGALEHFSVAAEQRTGVVRNAQGLNPETLHDTARGAMALMSAAQRRTRMIARRIAEQLKPLYLGIHAEILSAPGTVKNAIRLRGKWVQIDPTQWGAREDLQVQVGLGSGRNEQMALLAMIKDMMQSIVEAQGGLNGPIVKAENVYALADRMTTVAGVKGGDRYWTDPATAPPQPPQPNPALMEAQAKQQLEQQKLQQQAQSAQASQALEVQRLQLDAQDRAHTRFLAEQKLALDNRNAEADRATDFALKLADINGRNSTNVTVAQIKANAEALRAHTDLVIQASEHEHATQMAEHAAAHAEPGQMQGGAE
jgi:hypothetical protein